MSKRTDAIYGSLDKLDNIQKEVEGALENSDAAFAMGQELKNLRFWIDSLYRYNGKSTSAVKKSASAENGRKGGRPPREISGARREMERLVKIDIPEIDHKIVMADSNEELDRLKAQREKFLDTVQECRLKIRQWENQKKLEK